MNHFFLEGGNFFKFSVSSVRTEACLMFSFTRTWAEATPTLTKTINAIINFMEVLLVE